MSEGNYWSSDDVRSYFVSKRSNERLDFVLKTIPGLLPSVNSILDAGCGYGRNLAAFAERHCELYAFDPCADALYYTQKRHSMSVSCVRMCRLEDEPWRGERKFDFIVCDGVLHQCLCVDDVRRAVEYLADMVYDGGHVFLSVFTSDSPPTGATCCGGDVWRTDEGLLMTLVRSTLIMQMFNDMRLPCIGVWRDVFELDVGKRSNLTLLLKRSINAN